MKTPIKINCLCLIDTCMGINQREWDKYMKGTTKANGAMIRKLIKKHLPELYNSLTLEYYNPYESQSRKKKGLLIYVHSMIEYFLEYQ